MFALSEDQTDEMKFEIERLSAKFKELTDLHLEALEALDDEDDDEA